MSVVSGEASGMRRGYGRREGRVKGGARVSGPSNRRGQGEAGFRRKLPIFANLIGEIHGVHHDALSPVRKIAMCSRLCIATCAKAT